MLTTYKCLCQKFTLREERLILQWPWDLVLYTIFFHPFPIMCLSLVDISNTGLSAMDGTGMLWACYWLPCSLLVSVFRGNFFLSQAKKVVSASEESKLLQHNLAWVKYMSYVCWTSHCPCAWRQCLLVLWCSSDEFPAISAV